MKKVLFFFANTCLDPPLQIAHTRRELITVPQYLKIVNHSVQLKYYSSTPSQLPFDTSYTSFTVSQKDFIRSEKGLRCKNNDTQVLKEFTFPSDNIPDSASALTFCEKYCSTKSPCGACSIDCSRQCRWNALEICQEYEKWEGLIDGDISEKPRMSIKYLLTYLISPQP